MNVFENLVVELKEENLLELTVIDMQAPPKNGNGNGHHSIHLSNGVDHEEKEEDILAVPPSNPEPVRQNNPATALDFGQAQRPKSENDAERRHKQWVDEIAALQMVEHVLTGVERDILKIEPRPHDDLMAKKSLHRLMQESDNSSSDEYFEAESAFLHEIESWREALAKRDAEISVADLRHYSETANPPLSPQPLFALLRFYRNTNYDESVRTKFDFVVTRLFSKSMGDFTRQMLCGRQEAIGHLKKRYSDWSATEYFSLSDDDPDVLLNVLSFEDFMIEAETFENFDELIQNDFFSRLGRFKSGIGSSFFSPVVAAAAIECNVKIGNKYVEMLAEERSKLGDEGVKEKYGAFDDRGISDYLGRNLEVKDFLEEIADSRDEVQEDKAPLPPAVTPKAERARREYRVQKAKFFDLSNLGVNKWLLAATILVIMASVGLYLWVNYTGEEEHLSTSVKSVNLETSSFKEYLKTASVNGDTFYGMTSPLWDKLSQEKKEELLTKMYQAGPSNGYKRVQLINGHGNAVGFASDTHLDVYKP